MFPTQKKDGSRGAARRVCLQRNCPASPLRAASITSCLATLVDRAVGCGRSER